MVIGWQLCTTLSLSAGQRFSLSFSGGLNYLTVGDTNAYLDGFNRRFSFVPDRLETFHSGVDLNAEIGYRITPRLEVAIGLGLVRDGLTGNDLITKFQYVREDHYRVDVSVKTIPLQLVLHYRLGGSARFSCGVHAAVFFNWASWTMRTDHGGTYFYSNQSQYWNSERETATGQGIGFSAGGRGEWKLGKHAAFTVDLVGRYAPLRNFSGQRQLYYDQIGTIPSATLLSTAGELWFFEYYDTALGRWAWELGVGGRPVGPGVRNVSRATVDFSGLALRTGLLFRF